MQKIVTSKNTSNKRIAKNVYYLYIRLFLMLIVGLYTSRLVLDSLGAVDYGLYNVVGSLVAIFAFVTGALASSASRFMSIELEVGTLGSQNRVFCMTLNCHLLFSAIVIIIAETIGLWYLYNKMVIPESRMEAASIVYQLSCISAILAIMTIPYRALIIANEHMQAFAYLSIFEIMAKLIIAYVLYLEGIDKLILFGVLCFILQVGVNLLYYVYCRRFFVVSKYCKLWDKALFKSMMIYSAWSTCSYITSSVVNQGYNLILNLFCGPVVNAARALAYQVQSKVLQFATNFQIALNPQIVKNFAAKDIERVEELVGMSIKLSFSLMFILLFPILVNIKGVLSLWLVEVPEDTELFVILICITAIFSAMSNPLSVVAEAANKLKKYNLTTIPIFIISLPISYWGLLSGFSAYFVFVVALITEFIGMWAKFFIAQKILSNPLSKALWINVKCIMSLFVFIFLGFLIDKYFNEGLIDVVTCGMLCFWGAVVWILYVIIDKNERKLVWEKVKSIRERN